MDDRRRLAGMLDRIDNRPYPAYRDLKGAWNLGDLILHIDHVQGDPFASPSRVRIVVPTDLDPQLATSRTRREATEDWLLRRFGQALQWKSRGSGKSGVLRILRPGPEITERSAVRLNRDGQVEVRFQAGLPARGRRVLGRQALFMLTEDIPRAAESLCNTEDLAIHVQSVVTQRALRDQLAARGLAAFVANGSILPRASGVDPAPMPNAIPFVSPPSLEVTVQSPSGPIAGMGIPTGVTVIVGGGFHGKSTLLQALQHGHLDHIPGDGRERVVSAANTVKIRAEDGRAITRVDISAFLRDLPGGRSTSPFSTEDASGSTSQAAALIEAIESGATAVARRGHLCHQLTGPRRANATAHPA